MKQTDNPVELDAILKEFWGLSQSSPPYPWSYDLIATKQARQKLNQYYADFYRNKMLEARKDELEALIIGSKENAKDGKGFDVYRSINSRIDDINKYLTAQFSKGDNDER